jgi:ornithine carbamoyltransferase
MNTDLLTFSHSEPQQIKQLLTLASTMKFSPNDFSRVLAGKSVVGLFEKPSLRTRVSLDIGINRLGGHFVYLDSASDQLSGREATGDMAMNLSGWANAIVARVNQHSTLQVLSQHAGIPVINALCDLFHPCQALADFQTMGEVFGALNGLSLVYLGDGNNVAHSLMNVGALLGVNVRVITPEGYSPQVEIVKQAQVLAQQTGCRIEVSHDPDGVNGADVLYTDTWQSMGNDTPLSLLEQYFKPYQLNQTLFEKSGAGHVMHCQPAHRGYEITDELFDSRHALIMQQSENRLYTQNAVLTTLINQGDSI